MYGLKMEEPTWKLVGKEVHVFSLEGVTDVYKMESNGDLTYVAYIADGKRKEPSRQHTLKKFPRE